MMPKPKVFITRNPDHPTADYYCDGVHDEVEINHAIEYLKTLGGGTVELDTATFNIEGEIRLDPSVIVQSYEFDRSFGDDNG